MSGYFGMSLVTLVTLLLFVGATGKSAQIPLYVWLPDAMAGPTPVCALIHAATMVTAGVYMVARLNFLFSMAPATLLAIATSAPRPRSSPPRSASTQNDIKKVLAYSTVWQLGYMFLAMGVGAYAAGIFHLMTHAFFKACLFLGSGSVIHAMGGEQDMRKMGGLRTSCRSRSGPSSSRRSRSPASRRSPASSRRTRSSGTAFAHGHPLLWALLWLGAGMTAFYMFRQVFMIFFGECRGTHEQEHHLHESPPSMTLPLVVLGALSIVGGFLKIAGVHRALRIRSAIRSQISWRRCSLASDALGVEAAAEHRGAEAGLAVLSLALVAAGWLLAYLHLSPALDGLASGSARWRRRALPHGAEQVLRRRATRQARVAGR